MSAHEFEFGLDTPAFVTVDESGQPLAGDVVIRNTIEEAVLAEAVGIDSFNIGEHYRPELMDSAGHVMLAAIAGRTERIRLGTAVTVLSTQDPLGTDRLPGQFPARSLPRESELEDGPEEHAPRFCIVADRAASSDSAALGLG